MFQTPSKSKDLTSIKGNEQELILEPNLEKDYTDLLGIIPMLLGIFAFIFAFSAQKSGTFIFLSLLTTFIGVTILMLPSVRKSIVLKIKQDFIVVEYKSNNKITHTENVCLCNEFKQFYLKPENPFTKFPQYYEICIEKNNNKKVRLLPKKNHFFVEKTKKTEAMLEKMTLFVQPLDENKIGEIVQEENLSTPQISARKITKEQEISKLKIQDLRKGVLVDYKLKTWEVAEQIQYDWRQGSTDTLYRLNNSENQGLLLLISQNLAVYQTWIEERLTYQELLNHNLDKIRFEPPLELNFKGIEFFKEHIEVGHQFFGNTNSFTRVTQYKYLPEDGKYSLRMLHHEDGDVFVFSGTKAEIFEFSNILTL